MYDTLSAPRTAEAMKIDYLPVRAAREDLRVEPCLPVGQAANPPAGDRDDPPVTGPRHPVILQRPEARVHGERRLKARHRGD